MGGKKRLQELRRTLGSELLFKTTRWLPSMDRPFSFDVYLAITTISQQPASRRVDEENSPSRFHRVGLKEALCVLARRHILFSGNYWGTVFTSSWRQVLFLIGYVDHQLTWLCGSPIDIGYIIMSFYHTKTGTKVPTFCRRHFFKRIFLNKNRYMLI